VLADVDLGEVAEVPGAVSYLDGRVKEVDEFSIDDRVLKGPSAAFRSVLVTAAHTSGLIPRNFARLASGPF